MTRSSRFSHTLPLFLIAALSSLLLTGPTPAWAEGSFEWMYGTWKVSYSDQAFTTPVNGYAIVSSSETSEQPSILLHLQDVVTKENFAIEVDDVRQTESEVILSFSARSPSRSKTFNGRANPEAAFGPDEFQYPEGVEGVFVKSVFPDIIVNVESPRSLPPSRSKAVVDLWATFPSAEKMTIRLNKANPDILDGVWQYRLGEDGQYGRRAGFARPSEGYVEGNEQWSRLTKNAIRSVTELKNRRISIAAEDSHPAIVRTNLKIVGDGLPVGMNDAREIKFDSPYIEYVDFDPDTETEKSGFVSGARGETISTDGSERKLDELEIRIRIFPGVTAGPKTFTLNGMTSVWVFEFEEQMEHAAFQRREGDGDTPGEFRNSQILLQRDQMRIWAEISSELMFQKRIVSLKSGRHEVFRTVLTQDPENLSIYRSEPLRVGSADLLKAANETPSAIPIVMTQAGEILTLYTADTAEPIEWVSVDVLEADALLKPKLIIQPPGLYQSEASLTSLTVDDPFTIFLRLPRSMLVEAADIQFRNTRTGETDTVEVRYRGGDEATQVVYLRPDSDLTMTGGLNETFLNWMGTHIDLVSTKNEDVVEVSYEKEKASFTVYDTRLKQRLGARRQQLETTKTGLISYYNNDALAKELREDAQKNVILIDHALQFARHGDLDDLQRVFVMEGYLRLLQEGSDHFSIAPSQPVYEKYGVPILSLREQSVAAMAINVESKEYQKQKLLGLYEDLSIGLNRFVLEQTGINGTYMIVYGRDVMGRKINMIERILGGLEAFQALESAILGTWGKSQFVRDEINSHTVGTPKNVSKDTPGIRVFDKDKLARVMDVLEDLDVADPKSSARRLLEKHGDLPSDLSAIAAAYDEGMSAGALMKKLDLTPEELAETLDKYYTEHLQVTDKSARRRMLRKFMGDDAPLPFDLMGEDLESGSTIITRHSAPQDKFRMPTWGDDDPLTGTPKWHEAEFPHQGRRTMDEYVNAMLDEMDKEDRLYDPSLPSSHFIERRQKALAALEKQHIMVDALERVTGSRSRRDYAGMSFWAAKGCDLDESLVGQLFTNRTDTSPYFAMNVLKMSEAEYRGTLENFLRQVQLVEDAATRQRIIDEYLASY